MKYAHGDCSSSEAERPTMPAADPVGPDLPMTFVEVRPRPAVRRPQISFNVLSVCWASSEPWKLLFNLSDCWRVFLADTVSPFLK